jgi:hypothetical protein
MYALHDNGRKLFNSARDCTPMQRFVYVMAKNEHQEDPEDNTPTGMDKGQQFHDSTSKFH